MADPMPVTTNNIKILRRSTVAPNSNLTRSPTTSQSIGFGDWKEPPWCDKIANSQSDSIKPSTIAPIERRALSILRFCVNNVITTAAAKGANNIIQTKFAFIRVQVAWIRTYSLIVLNSSTMTVLFRRNKATMIANPTATSAAAMAMIKKTKI